MIDLTFGGTLPDMTQELDLSEGMKEAAQYMMESVYKNFTAGGRPSGWAAKKDGSQSYLIKTGALLSSIEPTSDKTSFRVWTSKEKVPYCFVHQFGYAARNIPARPYMVFQKEDKEYIVNLFKDHIVKFFTTKKKPIGT